jgi:hypothetical protein
MYASGFSGSGQAFILNTSNLTLDMPPTGRSWSKNTHRLLGVGPLAFEAQKARPMTQDYVDTGLRTISSRDRILTFHVPPIGLGIDLSW